MPSTIISTLLVPAILPATAGGSLIIYLSSSTTSPFRKRRIALPNKPNETLGSQQQRDPFDFIDDDQIFSDGEPVQGDRFWRWTRIQKILFVVTLLAAAGYNLFLHLKIDTTDDDRQLYLLLIPTHCITLLLGVRSIFLRDVPRHWASTIHLFVLVFVQLIILATLALLPSTPIPSPSPRIAVIVDQLPHWIPSLRAWLPILHFPPMIIISCVRRGPPLYFPLDGIYPPTIIDAVPNSATALRHDLPNVSEEVEVTVPEWLMFSYATNVVKKGNVSETMDVWDLPILPSSMRALPQYTKMKAVYKQATRRLGKMEGFNLLWKLAKANKGPLIAQTVLAGATGAGYYVPHYLLKLFLNYLESDSDRSDPAWGWLLAFGLFISNAIIYIASGVLWSVSTTVLQAGIKLQLNTLLFGKTLVKKDIAATGDKLGDPDKAGEKKDEEKDSDDEEVNSKTQIMTLFTVDVDRVTEFVFHEFALIDAPIEIVVATIFLFKLLGVSALFGLLGTLFSLPLSHLASKVVIRVQEGLMKARDQRTALMNELLQGIRMLKFMAWERSFEKRIKVIRENELQWGAKNYQIEVGFNILWAVTPVIVTVISFLHFTLVRGQHLSPSIAFTSIAVFAELRYALTVLPETFIQALQGFVSCRRIEKYLSLAEVESSSHSDPRADITVTSATFTWPRENSTVELADGSRSTAVTPKTAFSLFDLSLRFPHGKLSLICGRLGSGKTLLLAGLLGEADLVAGAMDCPRSAPDAMAASSKPVINPADWILHDMVAYVPQQAWLQNASIKDNIVFNSPWDQNRYDRVLEACSLLSDLTILEDGDQTEIGEKGLNLSGGQKARVSLARAVYSRAGVLLLDDVLSAVDAHTAHALLVNCLQGDILRGRTVLVVSHHTALVSPAASYIVALENGSVKFSGKREEFVQCGLMEELDAEEAAPKTVEETVDSPPRVKPSHKSVISLVGDTLEPDSETSSLAPDDEETLDNSQEELKKQRTPRKLIEDEKRATGRIAWSVWQLYFRALGGKFWWLLFVVGMIASMLVPLAEKGWLGYWTGSHKNQAPHSVAYFVSGYAIVAIGGCFVTNIPYGVAYYGSIQASRKLHNAMLQSVLFATLRFHDTTSRGRLLNRFGKDIEGLDASMVDNFIRSLEYGLLTAVTFASITYVGGIPFVIAGCLILVVYYRAGSIYGQTSRDMRRLDSITKSPLYSLFGETVSGVAVIRAFGSSTVALKTMLRLADTNLLAFAWTWTVNRWLSARFNVLSSFVIGVTACAILISPNVSAASAGFALAFAATLSHNLLFVVRRFVQLEQSMVALERIKEYSELKTEAPEYVEPRPEPSWPDKGEISVQDLIIRYAPDLPNVLHGLSFNVKAQEKIGVVGQTGSGKSTLALSFFRFVEATEGKIIIDGIDISHIGLTDLRSRVTIIPQDPMILSGTIRTAIDVFDEYDDADIYAALKRVHLLPIDDTEEDEEARNKNVFRDLSNPVSEGGDNFSSGEKQLICMARAILRRNRLIFMDEATASIDYETDELISKTIREEFSTSTILTIAHRIRTIIDFDKVLVMDQGRILEYDDPAVLLRDHKSKFYGLCKATGKTEFKILKSMASEGEKKRQNRPTEP